MQGKMKRDEYIILVLLAFEYKERILQILLGTTIVLNTPIFVFTYN